MIDARVRSSSGGFEATNGFVRMALREASEQATVPVFTPKAERDTPKAERDRFLWSKLV